MQPLMLATDGSPSAAQATREAIDLARELHAPLIIVSVAHDAVSALDYAYAYGELAQDVLLIELKHASEVLTAVQAQAEAAGVVAETLALEGVPGKRICESARENEVRLVVIGAHGWGRLGRVIHGSVSEYVLHHAHVPVLIVAGAVAEAQDTVVETVEAASS
jgi:nucleotide-binding universal stress UspA family protein